MDKDRALRLAVDLTREYLGASDIKGSPNEERANMLADFVETLAARFEKMDSKADD